MEVSSKRLIKDNSRQVPRFAESRLAFRNLCTPFSYIFTERSAIVAFYVNSDYNQQDMAFPIHLPNTQEEAMSDLKDQIAGKVEGDLDPFKKILSKIPGFGGYVKRQERRDSDKLLRDTIYKRFRELEDRISAVQRSIESPADAMYIDDLEAAAIKLRIFSDRIRTAARGYSSLFEAVKINEEELTKIYEYDAALLDSADEVGRAIDNVEASIGSDGMPAAIRNLQSLSQKCIDAFERRDEVILA
jgi:hypothetical protein